MEAMRRNRISRRRFVNGTIRLAVVAPLVQVAPLLAVGQTRLRIRDAERRTLRAAVDVIIPAQGRMPAASRVGAVGYIERVAGADHALESLLRDGLRAIGAQAETAHTAHFDRLPIDRQTVVLAHFEATNTPPTFFATLRDLVYEAYYTQAGVQKLIHYNFRSGPRRTATLAPFDERLVARIRKEKPMYRQPS